MKDLFVSLPLDSFSTSPGILVVHSNQPPDHQTNFFNYLVQTFEKCSERAENSLKLKISMRSFDRYHFRLVQWPGSSSAAARMTPCQPFWILKNEKKEQIFPINPLFFKCDQLIREMQPIKSTHEVIAVPVHVPDGLGHWFLALIDIPTNRTIILDSLFNPKKPEYTEAFKLEMSAEVGAQQSARRRVGLARRSALWAPLPAPEVKTCFCPKTGFLRKLFAFSTRSWGYFRVLQASVTIPARQR